MVVILGYFYQSVVDMLENDGCRKIGSGFGVKKPFNGSDFFEINSVKGSGTTNDRKEYFYYDAKPTSGVSYYRIKQVDFNGEYKYSSIESINFNKNSTAFDFKLFPNPSPENSNPQLSFVGSSDGKVMVIIRDISGKVMSEKELALDADGKALVELNHSFNKGIYFLDAQDAQTGNKVHQKFIVN
jgi:hypothetical protein